jgi:predicted SnoaL-like aldol condensation-catalyzing enzyme
MIDIFRKKDVTAVDRHVGQSFIQHDPNLADGFAGMKSFAAEIVSSPAADITIFRTLVDGDSVLLHSRYEGLKSAPGPLIAFDLFRFEDDTIVEPPPRQAPRRDEDRPLPLSPTSTPGWRRAATGPATTCTRTGYALCWGWHS